MCLDINSEQGIALANGTLSVAEESANLTSSETNNGVNLHSYINDFVSQKDIPHTAISFGGALISSGTYFQNNNTVTLSSLIYTNVSGDDNIVNFIPKSVSKQKKRTEQCPFSMCLKNRYSLVFSNQVFDIFQEFDVFL